MLRKLLSGGWRGYRAERGSESDLDYTNGTLSLVGGHMFDEGM